ncbi:hypothetical protein ABZ807_10040 [Micromonospora sp. NPDC047548]|uniref:hypothetical protein n=1 Tax=Micromonospora sp. NPDC047548 TaxID=3155624 RepID=UPI0033D3BE71
MLRQRYGLADGGELAISQCPGHGSAPYPTLLEQIWLVGDERVQRAARMVVRHSWALLRVVEGHEDERAAELDGAPPETRLSTSLHDFVPTVRVQLRVPNPEHIASDEPDDWPEFAAAGQRSFRIVLPTR